MFINAGTFFLLLFFKLVLYVISHNLIVHVKH